MLHEFPSAQAAAEQLAENVADWLREAVEKRGIASLVVSGGSTPKPFFAALKKKKLPWDKVWVTLADERWVDAYSPDSNERMVREQLLPKQANFVGLKNDAPTPAEGVAETQQRLAELPQPYDVVVLGMGEDGHTASLFPQAEGLGEALDIYSSKLCAAIQPLHGSHPRMTQTASALLHSRHLVLHITGKKKRDVYEAAQQAGSCLALPIRAMLQQQKVPLETYWAP